MKFTETKLPGAWLIELDPREDQRGYFARTYCEAEFAKLGLNTRWPQCNVSYTKKRGTIRGMHYQAEPKSETKLVRCTTGAVFDVLVDLRRDSHSFGQWESFELSAANFRMLYVPAGIAHGFQSLTDNCRVSYQMSEFYAPELARGVRWADPNLAIEWPIPSVEISERDRTLPLISQLNLLGGLLHYLFLAECLG